MKTTLVLENGVRLSGSISEQDAFELLAEFVNRLGGGNKQPPKKDEAPVVKPAPVASPHYSSDTKLLAFSCEECGRFGVIKTPKDTGVGDVITCRCGHELQIKDIKQATGDCANCGTKFFNMSVINSTRELQCRNCKSPVDLVEKADGSLTGSHNLMY